VELARIPALELVVGVEQAQILELVVEQVQILELVVDLEQAQIVEQAQILELVVELARIPALELVVEVEQAQILELELAAGQRVLAVAPPLLPVLHWEAIGPASTPMVMG